MKQTLLAALLTILLASSATAQSRDLGAKRIVLDNGLGTGTLTLEYNGVGDQTLDANIIVPLPAGTLDQTLRHNGTGWEATSMLQTTATGVKTNGAVYKNVLHLVFPFFYPIGSTEHVIIVEAFGGMSMMILPPPELGRELTIRIVGFTMGEILPFGAEMIDGAPFYDLTEPTHTSP